MKKINWKILNAAFWIEVILSYVLPFEVVDEFKYNVGFPMPFITAYSTEIGISPLMSMLFNPLTLLADVFICYSLLSICVQLYHKSKS